MAGLKKKKEKLHDILRTAHTLDKADESLEFMKKKKLINPVHYNKLKSILVKEHKRLSMELEAV